ncbi:aspartic proteinase cdr1-like protein [Trifolium pratense]|uniref:Aspartic proteinase cdr1-like protein n=1 Tax=Trifolium pratense TaxID=57577 RepID=A0A2K3M4K2_TRIPR|nr:aspartic proteinase cdr1-like protein [Trifolium pratense]
MVSFSHALNNGFSVELIHRDSPKSPFYQATENKYQRIVNAVRRSINFANHFNKDSLTNTPRSTVIPDKDAYLMTYSVGTPPFKLYGFVDTGSDIVWFQCEPCKKCYNQTTPIFNPSKSSSYKNIPCSSKLCPSYTSCNDQNSCQYSVTYVDESYSQGDLSVETFTLESTTGLPVSFPKTVIGCGTNNTMTSSQGARASSGIVGLGDGPLSLITQLGSSIDRKFSYCLLPYESNTTSKLNFGDVAVVSGDGVVSTPIVIKFAFYVLTLEGFSIGNKRIDIRGSSMDVEGNMMIDSGTTLTFLPSDVYANLKSAIVESVKLERADDPNHALDLCYSVTSDGYNFPLITAHFKGADVKLHSGGTFVPIADDIICWAFFSSDDLGPIFGNLAQQNLLVGYDLKQKIVSFKSMDCSKV